MVKNKNKPPLVMIVGMHRSGTSVVGHLLEELGFDFGSNLIEGIAAINDRGFWEDREVVALNEHIFDLFGSSWFDFERLPGKWWEDGKAKELVGVAETWFMENFDREKPISLKDPRFCRLLPFWKRVLSGMDVPLHVLFVIRHPAEVAASLKKRDGFSLQLGYLLWLSYVIDGLYYSRNLQLSILDYQAVLSEPGKVIARLLKEDFSGMGLSKPNIPRVIKNVIDVESRHQKVEQVLLEGEVHGDVQTLAHELYNLLLTASSEEAKSVADKYRKRLYRLLDHHKEFLSALQATIKKQVEVNQKLSEIGSGHSNALAVIQDKDKQLEENKIFIEQCLTEIGNKDSLLANKEQELAKHQLRLREQEALTQKNSALWDRLEELQQVVHGRELKLSESLAYIEKCEAWIGELNILSEDCQRLLAEQRDYASQCVARIAEQDQWLTENKEYIGRCELRVREQDEGLHQRDHLLGDRLEKIETQQKEISEAHDHVARLELERESLGESLRKAEDTLGECYEKINHQIKLLGEKEQHIEWQQKEIIEARGHVARLELQHDSLNSSLQDQEKQIAELLESLENKQCEITDKIDSISQLESRLSQEQESYALENRKTVQLELQLYELQTRLAETDSRLSDSESRLLGQQATLDERQQELENLRNVLVQRDDKLVELDRTIKDQQKNIADTRGALSNRELRIAEHEKTIMALQTELAQSHESEKQKEERIRQQESLLSQQLMTLSANSEQMASMDNQITGLQGLAAKQDAELAGRAEQIDSQQLRIRELEKMLAELRAEKQQVEADHARLVNLDTLGKQRIALQKKQMDAMKAHTAALESELIALNAQNDSKNSEIERYRSYRVVRLIDKLVDTDK